MFIRRVVLLLILVFVLAGAVPSGAQESGAASRKLIDKPEPTYPALARKNNLTGTVKLRVLVAADGRPKSVVVLGGNPVFVEDAADSVKKWKWSTSDHESTEMVEVKFSAGS